MSFTTPTRNTYVSSKGSLETLNLAMVPSLSVQAPSSPLRSPLQRGSTVLRPTSAGVGCPPLPPTAAAPLNSSRGYKRSEFLLRLPLLTGFSTVRNDVDPFATPSDGMGEVMSESATCSVYCKRGRRRIQMEDRYKMELGINGDPKLAFFGVFDGHGGNKAAEFASQNIGKLILEEVLTIGEDSHSKLEDAVKTAYLKTDSDFLKEEMKSGTCCVTALVRNGNIVVSNTGDCRAVMSHAGRAEALTSDHKPSRDDERIRIQNHGGWVFHSAGQWRVNGVLAVSRGIGDSNLKHWVIAEPETKIIKIEDDCEFLILASDGLWNKVSNQEAVDIVRPMCLGSNNPSSLSACRRLADLSISRGSSDDISVMLIQLQHFA